MLKYLVITKYKLSLSNDFYKVKWIVAHNITNKRQQLNKFAVTNISLTGDVLAFVISNTKRTKHG